PISVEAEVDHLVAPVLHHVGLAHIAGGPGFDVDLLAGEGLVVFHLAPPLKNPSGSRWIASTVSLMPPAMHSAILVAVAVSASFAAFSMAGPISHGSRPVFS